MEKVKNQRIAITKNGPYAVSGSLPLAKEITLPENEQDPDQWQKKEDFPLQENYLLCRCGQSKNKPYCDQTHLKINFDGTETASRKKYSERAIKFSGPELDLTDVQELCSNARFCHKFGGTWNLTETSNNQRFKELAIQQSGNCPSGRLIAWDKKTGKPIEPDFKPSISATYDSGAKTGGPLWVKGNVPIESSDGTEYEIRNRVTLCRCGKSANKPFCDGTHVSIDFNDAPGV